MTSNAAVSPTVHAPARLAIRARLAALTAALGRFPLSIHQVLFRLAIAGVFLKAGLTKVASWESTVALFREEYRVPLLSPDVAAALASSVELGCSTLLLLGLASRLATLPLLGMLLTIQLFVYPQAWPEHLTWASILLFLLTRGPGAVSLDRLLGLELAERHGRS
jgi:putative oxidoreductase